MKAGFWDITDNEKLNDNGMERVMLRVILYLVRKK
jgi:hypothetical protein